MQDIQCDNSNFFLDISKFSSLLYVHNAHLIGGIPWRVTLNDGIYIWSVLCISEKMLLLRPPSLTFPLATYSWDSELDTFTTLYSFWDQPTSSAKAEGPTHNFGPLSLQTHIRTNDSFPHMNCCENILNIALFNIKYKIW